MSGRFIRPPNSWICHFHIKDGYRNEKNEVVYYYPGEGWANLKTIMGDLLKSGYRGYFSMELISPYKFTSAVNILKKLMFEVFMKNIAVERLL